MRAALRLALILLTLACFAGTAASQERPAWLRMAMAEEAVDPEALREAAGDSEEQQKLVAAIELAWLRRDAEAAVALRRSADTLASPPLRLDALNMLMAVHLRTGDYALAAAAGRESKALAPPSPQQSDLLTAAEALSATPPMTLSGEADGVLPLRVEKDGIPRAKVAINGSELDAVFDTGATFSAVSRSVAKKAGVRQLKATLRISPTGNGEVSAGIGVVDELVVAEARFHNVVVLILPDDDLDIFGDDAKIGAIVGLPVFLKMGRIAILPRKDGLAFAFGASAGPSGGQPGGTSDMRLHKLIPVVTGTLKRPEPAPIGMLLDTGANETNFYDRFAASFPELVAAAPAVSAKRAVIGEASLSRQARRLGDLRFELGGKGFVVNGANVYADQRPSYDGALGLDILRMGFIADFDAMTFELAPGRESHL